MPFAVLAKVPEFDTVPVQVPSLFRIQAEAALPIQVAPVVLLATPLLLVRFPVTEPLLVKVAALSTLDVMLPVLPMIRVPPLTVVAPV